MCVYCWRPLTNEIKPQEKYALTKRCAKVVGVRAFLICRMYIRCLRYLVAEPDAVDGCILKANNDDVDEGPLLGYLAGMSGRHGRHSCGSERSPWLVTAQRGQRVRLTLMDFSSTADELDVIHVTDDAVQSQKTARQDNDGPSVLRPRKFLICVRNSSCL